MNVDELDAANTLFAWIEFEWAHHSGNAIRLGQHKCRCHCIPLGWFVCQDIAAASLIIVIIDKDKCLLWWQHTPCRTPIYQRFQIDATIERSSNEIRMRKLGDGTQICVLRSAYKSKNLNLIFACIDRWTARDLLVNCFAASINDFLINERFGIDAVFRWS